MEEEKIPEIETNHSKENKPKNKFIIKYIIFTIILVLITAISIYFTIKYIDKDINETQILVDPTLAGNEEEIEQQKMVAEDSKYAITSYTETYNTNSLEIKYYYDVDGNITKENPVFNTNMRN